MIALVWASGAGGQTAGVVAGSPRGEAPAPPARGADAVRPEAEVVSLRQPRSRTFRTAGGHLTTRIFTAPVNYRDAAGRQQPIDSRLVRSDRAGFAFENRANSYEVALPDDLAGPVRIARGADAVRFSLIGARGSARVAGTTATYADAIDGVDVEYVAGPNLVKETLTLESAQAPSTFRFRLDLSDGLRPRTSRRGDVVFVRSDGTVAFTFAPPFIQDQTAGAGGFSDAVDLDVQRSGDGYVATLRADRDWLERPERRFPVVVDPTLVIDEPDDDCELQSGTRADVNFCAYETINVGFNGVRNSRALLRFDVADHVPANVEVLNAELGLVLDSRRNSTAVGVDVHALARSWTGDIDGATWNRFDGTNPWTTPGGDFDPAPEATNPALGATNGRKLWHPTRLVQRWVDGAPDAGMLLKTPEDTDQLLRFISSFGPESKVPYLEVSYEPRTGDLPRYTFDRRQLTPALNAGVNLGNGNLLVREVDRQYTEPDAFYALDRFYNNLFEYESPTGAGWTTGYGGGVGLAFYRGGAVSLDGPSAFTVSFVPNPDGSYSSPEGVDYTLVRNADGTYIVTGPDERRLTFDEDGLLNAELAGRGQITYVYDGSDSLISQTDSRGRTTRFAYDGDGYLETMTEASGEIHRYDHDSAGNLTRYTSPSSQRTTLTYSGLNLTRIQDPVGRTTSITYDSRRRVTAVIDGLASDASAPRTTYTYGPPGGAPCVAGRDIGRTTVVRPDGSTVVHCFDQLLRLTAQDPPAEAGGRPPFPPVEDFEPIDPTAGDDYICQPEPAVGDTYRGEDPPADPDADTQAQRLGAFTATADVSFGIADNNRIARFNIFDNPAFRSLGARRVRRTMAWNVVVGREESTANEAEYQDFTAWVTRALQDGYIPLLSLDRCRNTWFRGPTLLDCEADAPSRPEYEAAITAILTDPVLGRVKEWTAWNEPNNFRPDGVERPGFFQPTTDGFDAGQYWYAFWQLCRASRFDCTVAAGDFLDARLQNASGRPSVPPAPPNQARYFREYRRGMRFARPERWAWHAYRDGERTLEIDESSSWWGSFRAFATQTQSRRAGVSSPPIWLTEQGATRLLAGGTTRITADDGAPVDPGVVSERARLVTSRLTRSEDSGLLGTSERITRFYYYHLIAPPPGDGFDAGLLNPNGTVRANFSTYRCRTGPAHMLSSTGGDQAVACCRIPGASSRRVVGTVAVTLVALLLAADASAAADSPGAGTSSVEIGTTTLRGKVAAFRGRVMWSAPTGSDAERRYVLMQRYRGQTSRVPVATQAFRAFDVDLGPDGRGGVVAVYSRCPRREGASCDVYRYDLRRRREQMVEAVSTPRTDEVLPTVWGSRIAFVRGQRVRRRRATGTIHVVDYRRAQRSRTVAGGTPPSANPRGPLTGHGPAAIELRGRRLAFTWDTVPERCPGQTVSNFGDDTSTRLSTEVWLVTLGGARRRVAAACRGDARWSMSAPALTDDALYFQYFRRAPGPRDRVVPTLARIGRMAFDGTSVDEAAVDAGPPFTHDEQFGYYTRNLPFGRERIVRSRLEFDPYTGDLIR